MSQNIEIVVNYISKFQGAEFGNHQNYREQYVDKTGDNTSYFDESIIKDLETLKRDKTWPFVPAEASPLTCGINSRNVGR